MAAVMRGLDAEAYDRQYGDRELVQRIFGYFRPHRRPVALVGVCVVVLAALGAAPPLIIADGIRIVADQGDAAVAPWLIVIITVAGVGTWLMNWVRRRVTTEVIADIVLAMRRDAFGAAAWQDLSFHDEFSAGRVVSRITSDTEEFGQVVVIAMDLMYQVAVAAILIAVLVGIEWRLTLAVLVMAPFVSFAALQFRAWARRATRQASRAMAEVNQAIQEAVTGISVAKNFRQEARIYEDFVAVNEQAYRINVRRGFVLANIFPTLNAMAGLGTAALVYFGGLTAVSGVILISSWYLFIASLNSFWFPITNLSAFWSQFQAGLSAAERVFALVDAEPTVVQTDGQVITTLRGEIAFHRVAFRYTEKEDVLPDFTLTIGAGESVALVGHTGAGKSSIIKLVARFYEFQGGQITIDGHDIRTLDLDAYRRQLGIVSQVPFLFAGSVADNIRYGRPDAGDADILALCRRIGGGEWLETLPDGLQSEVGERGARLSMGQRQLVALVRVMLQGPRIFILDEATASIDPFTETQIQEALGLIMAQTTAIIIAHRLSTVRAADRIIVLQNGAIIEAGNHDALMAAGGHYAHLYDTYFRHQSPDYIHQATWRDARGLASD